MAEKSKIIPALFLTFLKIGAFTFGGGYAMIPLIQREAGSKHHWVIEDDILEIVAIAESTPGPIAINAATFIGYHTAGFWGAFAATLGVVLPSFLIILAVSYILPVFEANRIIQFAFFGIRAGVLALILKACISMYKAAPKHKISYFIMGLSFILVALVKVNAIYVILGCALLGLISSLYASKKSSVSSNR
ncbi:MAG: chromate transporter [Eubacterium sp.]|nr:chromate transporter [Eubacterium sp.]